MRDIRDMEEFAKSQNAIEEIYSERRRQVDSEGWTPDHDDAHDNGELALAASAYAIRAGRAGRPAYLYDDNPPSWWPWDKRWWKPKDARRDLIRAGALIVAEIERLDRAAKAVAA
jgi:hypothetical protein